MRSEGLHRLPQAGTVDAPSDLLTPQEDMMICDRCGWLIPADCTCRRQADQHTVIRRVAERHRKSVARASASRELARDRVR